MTDHPTPVQPLTAESVGLLKAGDVLRHYAEGVGPVFDVEGKVVVTRHGARDYSQFTFIGRPGPDGWIAAPEGGWKSNPVPGVVVEWRNAEGDEGEYLSDHVAGLGSPLNCNYPIIAFRLTPTSPPIEDAERAGDETDLGPFHELPEGRVAGMRYVEPGWLKRSIENAERLSTDPVSDVEVREGVAKGLYAADVVARNNARPEHERLQIQTVDLGQWYDREASMPLSGASFVSYWSEMAKTALALIARSQPKGAGQAGEGSWPDWPRVCRDARYEVHARGEWEAPTCPFCDNIIDPTSDVTIIGGDCLYIAHTNCLPDEVRPTDNADGLSADRESSK